MKTFTTLDADDARLALDACGRMAGELQAAVTIAIVDASGSLLSLRRMDGARSFTIDLATRKARTSAAVGVATGTLQKLTAGSPLSAELLAVAGGQPCMAGPAIVGAIGISGSTHEIDDRIAEAGITALQGALAAAP